MRTVLYLLRPIFYLILAVVLSIVQYSFTGTPGYAVCLPIFLGLIFIDILIFRQRRKRHESQD